MNYCQSCAMPLDDDEELLGTNTDGSKNDVYCKYCYENGSFTWNCTMNEMIEFCVPHMKDTNPDMSETEGREIMRKVFPTLKRCKKDRLLYGHQFTELPPPTGSEQPVM